MKHNVADVELDEMEKFEEKSAPPNKQERNRLLGGVSRAKIKEATAEITNPKDELITVNKSDYLALAHSVDVLLRLVIHPQLYNSNASKGR